jgi:hypothetical protein
MRFRLPALLLSGVVVASSACSDVTTTSPLAAPERAGLSQSAQQSKLNPVSTDDDVESYTFTIDPTRRNQLQFGAHSLDLPANAVCVESSGYGPDWWNAPCATSTRPLTISVQVRGASKGLPRVDLLPAVRFHPHTVVTLELFVKRLSKDKSTFSVLYCGTSKATCIDESLTDPTLTAHYDRPAHTLFRRIKHFSGYLVAERQ